jgi:hypothetical protein
MTYVRVLIAVLAVCCAAISIRPRTSEAVDTSVKLEPGTYSRVPNNTQDFVVPVKVSDVALPGGLGGYAVTLEWDPLKVSYVTVANSTFLASTGRVPFCDAPEVAGNTVMLQCASLDITPLGPQGGGTLMNATFKAISGHAIGTTSDINITAATLLNVNIDPTTYYPTIGTGAIVKVVFCPDVNLDNVVNNGDLLNAALNLTDRGVDSGSRLAGLISPSATVVPVTDQSLLNVGEVIAVDNEQMMVTAKQEGSPDTVTVTRAFQNTTAKIHNDQTKIYRPTIDGNNDGKKGYTVRRDAKFDGVVNNSDLLILANVLGQTC